MLESCGKMLIILPAMVAAFAMRPPPFAKPNAAARPPVRCAPDCVMLGVGDPFPPSRLEELCTARGRRDGKRVVVLFFGADDDDGCMAELDGLDEIAADLYLRACEVVAVRNSDGVSSRTGARYPFLNLREDRRDRLRAELGVSEKRTSYVIDAVGTVVSSHAEPSGHAERAMRTAESLGWERETGWEGDFGGAASASAGDATAPTAAERREYDAERWRTLQSALRLPARGASEGGERTELEERTAELLSTGVFAEWKDPEPEEFPNPIGDGLNRRVEQVQRRVAFSVRELQDDPRDALDAARGRRAGGAAPPPSSSSSSSANVSEEGAEQGAPSAQPRRPEDEARRS